MKNWFSQFFAQVPQQGHNAARLALVFMVAASLAVFVFVAVALQAGVWQAYAVTAGFAGFFVMEALVIKAARLSKFDTAGILLVLAVCYVVLVMISFMQGIGLWLSLALAVVIVEIVFETLSGRLAQRVAIAALAFAFGMLLFDKFLPWDRPALSAVQYAIPTIAAGTVITIAFLMIARLVTWRDLSLARKLLVAFGSLFIFSLMIAASGLWGLNRVQGAYEDTLAGAIEIQHLDDHMDITLLEARSSERDFLLRWQAEGFGVAYENYVKVNQEHTAELKEILVELNSLAYVMDSASLRHYSREQYESDISALNQYVLAYEQAFESAVRLLEQRGHVDTGLEGEFRTSVQAIEAKIYDHPGLDHLELTLLQIRRREKDYLLRGDLQYVINVHDLVLQLKIQIGTSELLTSSEKVELDALADEYLVKFDGLVEKDRQIADTLELLHAAAGDVETTVARLEAAGQELAAQGVQVAQLESTQTFTLTGIATLVVLILSMVLAFVFSGQITSPVRTLTNVALDLASGNYDAQAGIVSGDEIGTLANAFNGMAKEIKQALATVAQRAAELQTVAEVSASTSTVLETDKLLWNVSNLTKERFGLYHAHIYLMNQAEDTLVLAAGAGEAGKQMVAEGRSISLDREQSLVARAARERRGVVVNDVRSAVDFLPNPLLPETRAELAVPMIIGDEVLGVFDIQSDEVGRFTQENADIQTTLAAQIAVAVKNARSYTDVQARAEREALIASIGQKIQSTSTVESALQVAIRELGRALSQDTSVVLKASDNSTQN